jgi:hypothetical protein
VRKLISNHLIEPAAVDRYWMNSLLRRYTEELAGVSRPHQGWNPFHDHVGMVRFAGAASS